MMYSVWNQGSGAYDYYESPAQQASLNVEKPTHLVNRTLGMTIDQAAWPLPGNVKRVGSGDDAIGRVASIKRAGALGDDVMDGSAVKVGLFAASVILIWKYAVKSRRRRT